MTEILDNIKEYDPKQSIRKDIINDLSNMISDIEDNHLSFNDILLQISFFPNKWKKQ
jgi:hypothetical protein